jgi:hypothetical protein
MPSPFPGMNPYLELATAWESFHPGFITMAQFQIAAQLPDDYTIHIQRRVYLHEPPAGRRLLDAVDIERVGNLTIRNRDTNDPITVVELLSPTNKYPGPDREQYLGKRRELLRSRTHFVEIDLLRGGPRMPPDELPTCDYCAIVSRVDKRPQAGVWPWRLRDSMPSIPIPIRTPDPDACLDLKAVIDQVYDGGRYGDYIYTGLPEPRLSPDDSAWAAAFIPQKP